MKFWNRINKKPIIIWWGVNTSIVDFEEGIRAEEPIPILKKFLIEYAGINDKTKQMARCPSILDELQNVYGGKPYYDYKLNIDSDDEIITKDHSQRFFDSHIDIKSKKLMAFRSNLIFFAPYEKSLVMSQVAPSLEDNDIANKTLTIPGQFDIGKYFRCLEFAFIFKKETSSIQFLREQVYFYIRFHTTRPIIFRQFYWDKEINKYDRPMMAAKKHKYSKDPINTVLPYYYKLFDKFQFKKKIIKIIEKNLTKC